MLLVIDSMLGRKAFIDALALATDWLAAAMARPGLGETPAQFVQRQVTAVPRITSARDAFRLYCTNSQNRSGANNLLSKLNWDNLGTAVLSNYDHAAVAAAYPCTPLGLTKLCNAVLAAHTNAPILNGNIALHAARLRAPRGNKTAAWVKLLTTIQEGAALFCAIARRYPSMPLVDALVDPIDGLPVSAVTLANLQQVQANVRVKHIGDAIAANFLKDLGNDHFFKADTHTCDVVGFAFDANAAPLPTNRPWHVIEKALVFSHATEIPMAHIDRVMWLAGSGRFLGPVVASGPWVQRLLLPTANAGLRKHQMADLFRAAVTRFV